MSKRNPLPVRLTFLSALSVIGLVFHSGYAHSQVYPSGAPIGNIPNNLPPPVPGTMPIGVSGAQPMPGSFPGAAPASGTFLGGFPGTGGNQVTGDSSGLPGVVTDPPAIVGSLGLQAEMTTGTADTTGTGTGFTESFVFLFRDDPDFGIVREAYTQDEAKEQIEKELGRLAQLRLEPRAGQGPGPQQAPQGVADRATVEWDFYYEQLQMYQEYVQTKVLPGIEDLPGSAYDPSALMSGVLTERTLLYTEYQRASLALQTKLTQENAAFYERLDAREDLRRNFLEWIEERKDELTAWADAWKVNIESGNFKAGNAVNRDSWYAKMNFRNPEPMAIRSTEPPTIISKNPVDAGHDAVNIVSGNLTPYDLLDSYGRPRQPNPESAPTVSTQSGLVLLDSPQ
jgi:hypothetical protein